MTKWAPLLLVCLTLAVYARMAEHGYVYEDRSTAQAIGATHQPSVWPSRRIVTSWSYYLLAQIEDTPQMQHAGNLAIHLLNGALAGGIAWWLGLSGWWLVAGIVLVHPLNTQAVAYAANRADLLMALGALSAVYLAIPNEWDRGTLIGVVLCGLFALGAKEAGVAVVGLVALVGHQTAARRWSPWFLGSVASLAGVALLSIPLAMDLNKGTPIDAWAWASLQATAIWRYLLLALIPLGQSIEHDVYLAPMWLQSTALVAWLLVGLGLYQVYTRPWGMGLAWAWIALAPRLLVQTPYSLLTEHQMYLAMPGLAIAGVAGLERLAAADRRAAYDRWERAALGKLRPWADWWHGVAKKAA